MEDHTTLIAKLWKIVDNNGVFAAQIPRFGAMPINIALNNILEQSRWSVFRKYNIRQQIKHDLNFYYEILSAFTDNIVLWETNYYHILPSTQSIIDFIRSTALKPYLDNLITEDTKKDFENDLLDECKKFYKEHSNGNVLFPFQRMFIIAYKK
jgi:trans-aconitate 2-methyltransferase